jgi:hypothetical protein
MKISPRKIVMFGVLCIGGLICLILWRQHDEHNDYKPLKPLEMLAPKSTLMQSNIMRITSHNALNMIKAADLSDEERASLRRKFDEGMKPAIEKWLSAYNGHSPFKFDNVTLEKFHNRIGRNDSFYVYTFVLGDITLTIQESNGTFKVNYLMVRQAAIAINSIPPKGFVPNLSVPVTREDIIRMVKADTGVEFKPNEVIIRPSGAACALNGGAFVNLLPMGKDPNNALNNKVMMVFSADGNLANYERDPFF